MRRSGHAYCPEVKWIPAPLRQTPSRISKESWRVKKVHLRFPVRESDQVRTFLLHKVGAKSGHSAVEAVEKNAIRLGRFFQSSKLSQGERTNDVKSPYWENDDSSKK